MKIKKYFKWMMCLAVATLAFTACEDQPDAFENTGGVPVVKYIRLPYASSADSLIVSGYMGNTICLVGNNLTSIRHLYFNDQEAILNTSYITSNTMLVDIPNNIPGEVSDKIYMVNSANDTVTYDFHVSIPAPLLRTMSFEYAAAGSVVTLKGDYFIDDPNVPLTVKFGDVVAQIKNFTKTTIDVVVPDVEECTVMVSTVYGEIESAFHYKESRGLLFDFDGVTGLGNHGWHDVPITTDDNAPSGNYIMLGDGATTMSTDGGWNDGKFSFEYWPGSWNTPTDYPEDGRRLYDLVDFNGFGNMAVKFEMCIPQEGAWGAGAMQVIFTGTDRVTLGAGGTDVYGNVIAASTNAYVSDATLPRALYRPWVTAGEAYHTSGQWVTVTLPIATEFIYAFEGGSSTGSLKVTDFAGLTIFVVGGGIEGKECTPIIKIDNIRAVPN